MAEMGERFSGFLEQMHYLPYFMAGIWTKHILYVIKIPLGDTKVSPLFLAL
jgi:hypothetical protein